METSVTTHSEHTVAGYLTVQQVAGMLERHPQTIRRGIHAGRIQARRFGGGNSPFLISQVEAERLKEAQS